MPDKTAKLVLAYPPAVYGKAGTTISLLYKGDANYAVLSNIGSADTALCGWRMIKLKKSSSDPSAWQPFEWEHPPMRIGVEYRTTERYQQLPIYTKAVNFGAAPNTTSKTVEHGITGFNQCVDVSGILGGANLIGLEPGEKFLDISRNSDIIIWLAVCRHILAPIPNGGHLSRRRCKYGKGFCQL